MGSRSLGLLLLAACAAACRAPELRGGPAPTNIVLFYVDDWGWRDAGFQKSDFYATPVMDRFAAQGMVFTAAYSNGPNCAPSRAALMTGQYAPRTGVYTVDSAKRGKAANRRLVPIENRRTLAPGANTIAEVLRAAGYATACIGKWHLGDDPRTQGFEVNAGGTAKGSPPGGYFAPYKNPALPDGPEGEYLTDRLTDEALRFLDDNAARPFFLYLSHYAVHTPIQSKPEDAAPFADAPAGDGPRRAAYAGMLASVDRSLGRLLERLEALGLSERTLVVLTSDNGGNGNVTSNAPLRGSKGMLYEGGIRVPLAVRWPGRVAPGARCELPVSGVDFFPTFLDAAGVARPAGSILDGESLVAVLEGSAAPAREALYWHFPAYLEAYRGMEGPWRTTPAGAVRQGRWKLVEFFEDGRRELYDLDADPGESRDRAALEPERTRALAALLADWRASIGAPVPTELEPAFAGRR